jgi:hypothetical protein
VTETPEKPKQHVAKTSAVEKADLSIRRKKWPWWVKWPLLGCTRRSLAMTSFYLCMMASLLFGMLGMQVKNAVIIGVPSLIFLIPACGGFLFALWYFFAILWVDKRKEW